jgi:hypothetical protein
MKAPLAGRGFKYADAINEAVIVQLLSTDNYSTVLHHLPDQWKKCVNHSGEYTVRCKNVDISINFRYLTYIFYLIQGTSKIPLYKIPTLLNQMVKNKYTVRILPNNQCLSLMCGQLPVWIMLTQ